MKVIQYGSLTGLEALAKTLNVNGNPSQTELIVQAYQRWGSDFNRHVSGDYALVLRSDDNKLFLCRSAFSSHALYYSLQDGELQASTTMDPFKRKAKVNPLAIHLLLTQGIILPPLSLLEEVSQLASGESQLWQLGKEPLRLHQQQLTLAQKCQVDDSTKIMVATELTDIEQADFNRLPSICRRLGQPVSDAWQIRFAQAIKQIEADTIISDAGPEFITAEQSQLMKIAAKVLRPMTVKTDKKAAALMAKVKQTYEQEVNDGTLAEAVNFERWFALSFKLPEVWQQMRKLAESEHKQIHFNYAAAAQSKTLLNAQPDTIDYCGPFKFDDISIKNPYDAMQRLMWHGTPEVTKKLFKIVPPLSAGLLKRHPVDPKAVDGFCFTSLTLDHLAKQNQWSLANTEAKR